MISLLINKIRLKIPSRRHYSELYLNQYNNKNYWYYPSISRRVFTFIYLKQAVFLGYIVVAVSYIVVTIYGTCNVISHDKLLYLYVRTSRSMFVIPNITVFTWCRTFQVCCSGIFWMILKWFQLPLLLMVSHMLFAFRMRSISIVRYFSMF